LASIQETRAAGSAPAAAERRSRLFQLSEHVPPAIVFAASGYLCLIAAAEVIVISNAVEAVLIDLVLLSVFLAHAALARNQEQRRLLTVLGLAPLIRILSLTLPLQHIPLIFWYAIIAMPLVIASAVAAQLAGLTWAGIGLRLTHLRIQVGVAAFGFVLGATEYLILRPAALINHLTWTSAWVPALILLVGTGMTEEFVFRGVMQSAARGVFRRYTVLYVSLVFAALHIGYRSLVDFVFVLAVGLIFGYVVERTGSIAGTSISHGVANIMLYLIVPFISFHGFTGTMVQTAHAPVRTAVVRTLDQVTAQADRMVRRTDT
jgi:membrane protease YdiL (CAAX protease family)